jgi:arabinose-5-phosphate isomerase
MVAAKSGSVAVVNPRGKLTGVFTDGDLRRQMAAEKEKGATLAKKLRDVMTPNPICVSDDSLAVEAVKIFNQRNIDDLIVINARREPVGLIDLQDLPKLKLV